MKTEIIKIGKELYGDLSQKQKGTRLLLDEDGVMRFLELLAIRIEPLFAKDV